MIKVQPQYELDGVTESLLRQEFPGQFKIKNAWLCWKVDEKDRKDLRSRDVIYFLKGVHAGGSIG